MSLKQAFAKAISEGDEVAIQAFMDYYQEQNNNKEVNKYYIIILEIGDQHTNYVKVPKYIPIEEAKAILTYKKSKYCDINVKGIALVYLEFDVSDFEIEIRFNEFIYAECKIWEFITPTIAKCISEYDYSYWQSIWNTETNIKFQYSMERMKEIARKFEG